MVPVLVMRLNVIWISWIVKLLLDEFISIYVRIKHVRSGKIALILQAMKWRMPMGTRNQHREDNWLQRIKRNSGKSGWQLLVLVDRHNAQRRMRKIKFTIIDSPMNIKLSLINYSCTIPCLKTSIMILGYMEKLVSVLNDTYSINELGPVLKEEMEE